MTSQIIHLQNNFTGTLRRIEKKGYFWVPATASNKQICKMLPLVALRKFASVSNNIMTPSDFKQTFKKTRSEFINRGRISECFYHDKSECKGIIKQSHSIQRNNRLSIIEGTVNGQNVIYSFTGLEFSTDGSIETLKPIGKKVASTFFGFCEYHDTLLFSPIENFAFDDSDYHCFLHSYRSFAHSYHIKKESLKAYSTEPNRDYSFGRSELYQLVLGTQLAVNELETEKKKLDHLIQNKSYGDLEYLTYILPKKIPIACSSIINPEYSYKNKPLNNNVNEPYSMIMLTVLPDYDKTIIILACFEDDTKGKLFLDELNNIKSNLDFEKAISSVLINNAENTFFSPDVWTALGRQGQRQLCLELEDVIKVIPKKFVHSKINFFDQKFSSSKSPY
ncbi:MAG TPA: hypothetical protein VNG53_04060 [Bacteroidia bacterium]|nr:hypothetical protein [Bacteroidia bacterium]